MKRPCLKSSSIGTTVAHNRAVWWRRNFWLSYLLGVTKFVSMPLLSFRHRLTRTTLPPFPPPYISRIGLLPCSAANSLIRQSSMQSTLQRSQVTEAQKNSCYVFVYKDEYIFYFRWCSGAHNPRVISPLLLHILYCVSLHMQTKDLHPWARRPCLQATAM